MSSRTELWKKLIRATARELGEAPSSEIVKHISTLKLLQENLRIRLLAGERVDPADLVRLDEALKQYLPQGKPISINVHFVEGVKTDAPPPESGPPEPPPGKPATDHAAPAAGPSKADNVVPLRPAEKTASGPSFTGVYEPWRAHVGAVGGGGSPFHASPFPPGGRSW